MHGPAAARTYARTVTCLPGWGALGGPGWSAECRTGLAGKGAVRYTAAVSMRPGHEAKVPEASQICIEPMAMDPMWVRARVRAEAELLEDLHRNNIHAF